MPKFFRYPALIFFFVFAAVAAPDRPIPGNVHHLANAQNDRGAADPLTPMNNMALLLKPSAAQQSDLDQLLADQQNPASPLYRQWLTPEAYATRFGLSETDLAKVSGWLASQGFVIRHQARGRNWIAFRGAVEQTERAFHTSIHNYTIDGATRYANSTDPSIPEALADLVAGFIGLNNFPLQPAAHLLSSSSVVPAYNTGASHYMAPADFATIYDLAPLYKSSLDGTGQSIAIVGESDVLPTDLAAFRALYGLPAKSPAYILYDGVDPGFTGAVVEGTLDLEWSGALAPNANISYVYGASALEAMIFAIDLDLAPIVSVSYSGCENDFAPAGWEPLVQQANVLGITIVAASGDAGPAGCDTQGFEPQATRGRQVAFPAVLPEVSGIGGTEFVEGSGAYWAAANSATLSSALSYIPETAWNESAGNGLFASGGGASRLYSKPLWQTGPGVPADGVRDGPDLAFSAASHDAYEIYYAGSSTPVYGTSCGTPSMAAIVALVNQSKSPKGAGNINPQLYRMAQSTPAAFHDIATGNNIVPCAQGSPDCTAGSFGYSASPGYDLATGLGSIDAANLVAGWNSSSNATSVTLSASPTIATIDDTVQLTAAVGTVIHSGTPTGTVTFSIVGGALIGSAALTGAPNGLQTAAVPFPLSLIGGAGTFQIAAYYSGDATYSGSGARAFIQATAPAGRAAIVLTAPNTVWPALDLDAISPVWTTTLTLREVAGTAAQITGFTIDGQTQNLAQYFPSPDILPDGSLAANVVFRNLSPPVTHTFGLTGIDATGASWSRQAAVNYLAVQTQNQYSLTTTPFTVTQNAARPSCPFAMQLSLDDSGGFLNLFTNLYAGTTDMTKQLVPVFGTARLAAWGSIQGELCLSGIAPPAEEYVYAIRSDGFVQQNLVKFAPAPANPVTIAAAPASIGMAAAIGSQASAAAGQTAQATLQVNISDKTQQWTASVYPNNRTSSWLTLSQLSGTGNAQITLTASGSGFSPGAYRALIVIQAANAVPQYVDVPVMFVLGSTPGMSITGVANPASGQSVGAPGMLLSVFGAGLAGTAQTTSASPLPYSIGSISATVNNLAAPLLYVSPTQFNIQIPYEVGAGPAVLGVNNNGQVAGYLFQMAPSAPAIYSDGAGNLAGNPSVAAGGIGTLYMNGGGDVSPSLLTGIYAPATPEITPVMPLSVTVGGVPAILQFAGLAPLDIATTQVNFYVPASVAAGPQPVVVTVGGNSSPPVNVTVVAPGK